MREVVLGEVVKAWHQGKQGADLSVSNDLHTHTHTELVPLNLLDLDILVSQYGNWSTYNQSVCWKHLQNTQKYT